jgi:hypothetical protein
VQVKDLLANRVVSDGTSDLQLNVETNGAVLLELSAPRAVDSGLR